VEKGTIIQRQSCQSPCAWAVASSVLAANIWNDLCLVLPAYICRDSDMYTHKHICMRTHWHAFTIHTTTNITETSTRGCLHKHLPSCQLLGPTSYARHDC